MQLSERIQSLRRKQSLSQEELGERLGVSRQAVSKWETGQAMPDVDKIFAMSRLFDVSTDFLLMGEGERILEKRRSGSRITGLSMLSAGLLTLFVIWLLSVLYPCVYVSGSRQYTGLSGFLWVNDSLWLFILSAAGAALLLLWLFRVRKQNKYR